jgi:hypothetical protein
MLTAWRAAKTLLSLNSPCAIYRLMAKQAPLKDRFWRYAAEQGLDCWLWTGARSKTGYGVINSGGKGGQALKAHRVSWELHRGPIPDGMHVCHHCDTPLCVNPDHLFLGTMRDNMRDCAQKGRYDRMKRPKGERHGLSLLTEAAVVAIRDEYTATKPSHRVLAERYGVDRSTITQIVSGKTWRHLLDIHN